MNSTDTTTDGWLDEDPGPAKTVVERTVSPEDRPLLRTLTYIVQEARRCADNGMDDRYVELGRLAQRALLWHKADLAGDIELAQEWLNQLPTALKGQ